MWCYAVSISQAQAPTPPYPQPSKIAPRDNKKFCAMADFQFQTHRTGIGQSSPTGRGSPVARCSGRSARDDKQSTPNSRPCGHEASRHESLTAIDGRMRWGGEIYVSGEPAWRLLQLVWILRERGELLWSRVSDGVWTVWWGYGGCEDGMRCWVKDWWSCGLYLWAGGFILEDRVRYIVIVRRWDVWLCQGMYDRCGRVLM